MLSKKDVGDEGPGAECIGTEMFVDGTSRLSCRAAVFPRRSFIGNVGNGGVVGSGATMISVGSSVRGVDGRSGSETWVDVDGRETSA